MSGFLKFFLSGAFSVCNVASSPATLHERACLRTSRAHVFLRGVSDSCSAFLFAEDFSTCTASGPALAASGSRQGVWRKCDLFLWITLSSVVPIIRACGSEWWAPYRLGYFRSQRFRSSLQPLPGPQSLLSD